jgi:hypothetical protein
MSVGSDATDKGISPREGRVNCDATWPLKKEDDVSRLVPF